MPFPKRTKTFDLAAIGAPELKCTIIDPKTLTQGFMDGLVAIEDDAARAREFLAKTVVDWNFTDDAGQPLPLPKDKPEVINDLTIEVIQLITRQITGDAEVSKN